MCDVNEGSYREVRVIGFVHSMSKPRTKKIVEINASPRTTRNTATLDNDLARIVLKCTPQYDLRVPHFSQKSLYNLHKNAFYN